MSSAILYVAIVAIWAGVLIPRWLRNDASQELPSAPPLPADGADDLAGDASAPAGATERPDAYAPGREERRARVLSARRRLLGMLLVLVAGAAFIAAVKLTAWWVVVPPATMLAGYLCLLREAARADAERDLAEHAASARASRARAEARMAAYARAAAQRPEARGHPAASAPPAATVPDAPPHPAGTPQTAAEPQTTGTAEVLDISARVAEEPYDQYADAGLRAVGD